MPDKETTTCACRRLPQPLKMRSMGEMMGAPLPRDPEHVGEPGPRPDHLAFAGFPELVT